jgi:hypothetical protein
MRTIRQNVFETNSSSMHAVCILTETEYKNIKEGKGLIAGESHYKDINVEAVQQYFKEQAEYLKKRNAERKVDIEDLKTLENRTVDSFTNRERYLIRWDIDLYKSDPKKAIENGLKELNDQISENEKDLETLENEEFINRVANKVLYHIDALQYIKDNDFDYEEAGLTSEEFEYMRDFLSDMDNIDSFGYGYENQNVDSRKIDGQEIYVLSYSGYN